ncbi:MAG: hypothetical protein ACTSX9_01975 [Candidatus Njordarchaeales archaeon]
MSFTKAIVNSLFIAWLTFSLYTLALAIKSIVTKTFSEFVTFFAFSQKYVEFLASISEYINNPGLLISPDAMVLISSIMVACALIALSSESGSEVLWQVIIFNSVFILVVLYTELGPITNLLTESSYQILNMFFEHYFHEYTTGMILLLSVSLLLRFIFAKE